jgi:hypothetical protein
MTEKLSRTAALVSIVSYIAVPLLVAAFGWIVQDRVSRQVVGKDYVQMAVTILSDQDTKGDRELRAWAVAVIDETAPLKLSDGLKSSLTSGARTLSASREPQQALPAELLQPPAPCAAQPSPCSENAQRLAALQAYVSRQRAESGHQ